MENTNKTDLTSTMGSLMSTTTTTTNKDDRGDSNDSTPTSSTDASTTASTSQIVPEDPISSTSSEDPVKRLHQTPAEDDAAPVQTTMEAHTSLIVSEKDLLDMNITDTSTEKITEDVEDIVQDLENLLGEPTTSFDFAIKSREAKKNLKTAKLDGDSVNKTEAKTKMTDTTQSSPSPKASPPTAESKTHNNSLDESLNESHFSPDTVHKPPLIVTELTETVTKTDTKDHSCPDGQTSMIISETNTSQMEILSDITSTDQICSEKVGQNDEIAQSAETDQELLSVLTGDDNVKEMGISSETERKLPLEENQDVTPTVSDRKSPEMGQVEDMVQEEPDQIVEMILEKPDQIADTVPEEPDQIVEMVLDKPDQVVEMALEKPDQIVDTVLEEPDQIVETILEKPDVVEMVLEKPNQVVETVPEGPDQVVEVVPDQAVETSSSEIDRELPLKENQDVTPIVPDRKSPEKVQVGGMVPEKPDQIVEIVLEKPDQVVGMLMQAPDQVVETALEKPDQVAETVRLEPDQIVEMVLEKPDQVGETIPEEPDQIPEAVPDQTAKTSISSEVDRELPSKENQDATPIVPDLNSLGEDQTVVTVPEESGLVPPESVALPDINQEPSTLVNETSIDFAETPTVELAEIEENAKPALETVGLADINQEPSALMNEKSINLINTAIVEAAEIEQSAKPALETVDLADIDREPSALINQKSLDSTEATTVEAAEIEESAKPALETVDLADTDQDPCALINQKSTDLTAGLTKAQEIVVQANSDESETSPPSKEDAKADITQTSDMPADSSQAPQLISLQSEQITDLTDLEHSSTCVDQNLASIEQVMPVPATAEDKIVTNEPSPSADITKTVSDSVISEAVHAMEVEDEVQSNEQREQQEPMDVDEPVENKTDGEPQDEVKIESDQNDSKEQEQEESKLEAHNDQELKQNESKPEEKVIEQVDSNETDQKSEDLSIESAQDIDQDKVNKDNETNHLNNDETVLLVPDVPIEDPDQDGSSLKCEQNGPQSKEPTGQDGALVDEENLSKVDETKSEEFRESEVAEAVEIVETPKLINDCTDFDPKIEVPTQTNLQLPLPVDSEPIQECLESATDLKDIKEVVEAPPVQEQAELEQTDTDTIRENVTDIKEAVEAQIAEEREELVTLDGVTAPNFDSTSAEKMVVDRDIMDPITTNIENEVVDDQVESTSDNVADVIKVVDKAESIDISLAVEIPQSLETDKVEDAAELQQEVTEVTHEVDNTGTSVSAEAALDQPLLVPAELSFETEASVGPALVSDLLEKCDTEVDEDKDKTTPDNLLLLNIESATDFIMADSQDDDDMLNVISKSAFALDSMDSNPDALLSSQIEEIERQTNDDLIGGLSSVDEIFQEPKDSLQRDLELQDNLESLLAAATSDSVCQPDGDYNDKINPETANSAIDDILRQHVDTADSFSLVAENTEVVEIKKSTTVEEPLLINIDDLEKDKPHSPKITIKPIKSSDEHDDRESKGSLKMTITKQSDTMHSILKIYSPEEEPVQLYSSQEQFSPKQQAEQTVPKLIIKPLTQPGEQQHSPKMGTRSSKQVFSPTSANQRSSSPRITIKPIIKPENVEAVSPLKITIKPVLKPDDSHRQKHSPKLTIKPIVKPDDDQPEPKMHSPRVTIKPIVKPPDEPEHHSPRITIKPIVKPGDDVVTTTPRVTIKPIVKPPPDKSDNVDQPEKSSPKIIIKPIVKPPELDLDDDEEVKERIVLKINKGNIPSKESRKREFPQDDDKSEKLAKIKLKFSKAGHPQIVQGGDSHHNKRPAEDSDHDKAKKFKTDCENYLPGVTITPVNPVHSKLKEMLSNKETISSSSRDDGTKAGDSVAASSFSDAFSQQGAKDLPELSVFEIKKEAELVAEVPMVTEPVPTTPAPRKRGRPRKVPLEVREEFKDVKEEEPKPVPVVVESTRPKRSCRGQSVRTTLGIKPRKPRGPGRGRGSKRGGMGTRSTPTPPPPPPQQRAGKDQRLRQMRGELLDLDVLDKSTEGAADEGFLSAAAAGTSTAPTPDQSPVASSSTTTTTTADRADIVMYEEETRMSAETGSRAQTPAKQDDHQVGDSSSSSIRSQRTSSKFTKHETPSPTTTTYKGRRRWSYEDNLDIMRAYYLGTECERNKQGYRKRALAEWRRLRPDLELQEHQLANQMYAIRTHNLLTEMQMSDVRGEIEQILEARKSPVALSVQNEESLPSTPKAESPYVPMDMVSSIPSADVEESQSSVQSTATTESVKVRKGSRLEVHQEPEGAVISADQLAEYCWSGGGPFMLQEQVAQFLGIKSFKRKYPNIARRVVDMQERDFIRESGLAAESMCDLGLTAVNTTDILDIMYSDFQDKYEEYCKHQRDRQAKDLTNKQKALSLAAMQEKTKMDITQQAVQSAASWNATFNKTRKTQRKACMDLQTLTIHYPKNKIKQVSKVKMGNYPVALVPGQFTDYYKEFTPSEVNNLPINTMCYEPIHRILPEMECDSQTDASGSDSDTNTSDSDSSYSCSSDGENCTLCKPQQSKRTVAASQ